MAKKTEKKVTEEVIEKKDEAVVAEAQTTTEAEVKEEPSVNIVAKEVEATETAEEEMYDVLDDEETKQEDPVIDKEGVEVEKVEEPKAESPSTFAPQVQGRKIFHPWNGMLY